MVVVVVEGIAEVGVLDGVVLEVVEFVVGPSVEVVLLGDVVGAVVVVDGLFVVVVVVYSGSHPAISG